MSGLELIAAVLGVIAVWLTVKQNAWCWPIGLVMVLIYGWLFYEVKLYSGMLLQLAYALLQLYGWWQWQRPDREIRRCRAPAGVDRLPAVLQPGCRGQADHRRRGEGAV